jgi:GAF domain-containing protein
LVREQAANEVALAIAKILLLDETTQQTRNLKVMAQVSSVMRTARNRVEIAQVFLDQVANLFQATAVALVHVDLARQAAMVEFGRGVWEASVGTAISLENDLIKQVMATGQPFLSSDPGSLADGLASGTSEMLQSIAGVPLLAAQQLIGVLWIGCSSPIHEQQVDLLMALGNMAANALQRSALHESEHQQRELAQALVQAAAAINHSLDLDAVLDQILEQVVQVVGCPNSNILIEGNGGVAARPMGNVGPSFACRHWIQ